MRRIAAAALIASGPASAGPVIVTVDMDSSRPGIQSVVHVAPGTGLIPGVAIYIFDPEGTRSLQTIGYIGGLDRGIAFGHAPSHLNLGQVVGLAATAGTPANPANTGSVFPGQDRGFAGPEVQYIEYNAAGPSLLPTAPVAPIFTVDIQFSGAVAGDTFEFAVLDMVAVWRGAGHGAFSTGPGEILDTGGDAVPDGTPGLFGPDPDRPVPVPPAAYTVDYIDGGNGPARVIVGSCYANCDGSSTPPTLNVGDFVCFLSSFAAGNLYANCDGSTAMPRLNVNDFVCFAGRFAAGCP